VHLQLERIRVVPVDGQCAREAQRSTSTHLHIQQQQECIQPSFKPKPTTKPKARCANLKYGRRRWNRLIQDC
jgi:hypothetical protein